MERKLVGSLRGGYCFEQNVLLQMALEEKGYTVVPLLCRVRWGKPDDALGPNTAFTHLALKVRLDEGDYLVDVGFAGTNSIALYLSPPDLPFLKFWNFWKFSKRNFDVFGRFSKLIALSVSAVACT